MVQNDSKKIKKKSKKSSVVVGKKDQILGKKDPKQTKKLPKRRLADHFFGFFKKKTDLTISSLIGQKNIDAK